MTDKTLSDLDYLAIQTPKSETVHVMRVADHEGWGQGDPGRTVCGRQLDQMFTVVDIQAGNKPCKLCERTQPVIAIMFETSEVIQDFMAMTARYNEQMAFMQWLTHGMHFGYISPPFCGTHGEVPLTLEEQERANEGEDFCAYVVRMYGISAESFDPDEIP